MTTHRWAVLSGGGPYLWWQAGVLHGLEERGVRFDTYSGASAGALVAACAAAGRLQVLAGLVEEGISSQAILGPPPGQAGILSEPLRVLRAWKLGGYLEQRGLRRLIRKALPDGALQGIPGGGLWVYVTDWRTLESLEVTESHPPELVRRALLASTAIPGIFEPVRLELGNQDVLGIDGGVLDNVPLERAAHRIRAREDRETWELWLISAVRPVGIQEPTNLLEGLERIVARQLVAEEAQSIDRAGQLGFELGRNLHYVRTPDLALELADFGPEDVRVAWAQGRAQGFIA